MTELPQVYDQQYKDLIHRLYRTGDKAAADYIELQAGIIEARQKTLLAYAESNARLRAQLKAAGIKPIRVGRR